MKTWMGIILVLVTGCTLADVRVEVMSERTALENQVLGTYNALDSEMLLSASVRGVDSRGRIQRPPRKSGEQQDAAAAMQVLRFHADDLQAFKTLGWAGENNRGGIDGFPMDPAQVPESWREFAQRFQPEEFTHIIAQVNQAREVVMQRVIDLNENLSSADMPEIQRIFGRFNIENAAPGERVQLPDGTWTVKQ